jgi:hypothetical protein
MERYTNTSNWGEKAIIPLEHAIEIKLPNTIWIIYKIIIGGISYIGMSNLNSEKSICEYHIRLAKSGRNDEIHKQLRRYGYILNIEKISERRNEIHALLDIDAIKNSDESKPVIILNEEANFRLVEREVDGEPIIHVENLSLNNSLFDFDIQSVINTRPLNEVVKYIKDRFYNAVDLIDPYIVDLVNKETTDNRLLNSLELSKSSLLQLYRSSKRIIRKYENWEGDYKLFKEFLLKYNLNMYTKSEIPIDSKSRVSGYKDFVFNDSSGYFYTSTDCQSARMIVIYDDVMDDDFYNWSKDITSYDSIEDAKSKIKNLPFVEEGISNSLLKEGDIVVVNPFWPPFNVKTDNSVPSDLVTIHHYGYVV